MERRSVCAISRWYNGHFTTHCRTADGWIACWVRVGADRMLDAGNLPPCCCSLPRSDAVAWRLPPLLVYICVVIRYDTAVGSGCRVAHYWRGRSPRGRSRLCGEYLPTPIWYWVVISTLLLPLWCPAGSIRDGVAVDHLSEWYCVLVVPFADSLSACVYKYCVKRALQLFSASSYSLLSLFVLFHRH